MILAAGLTTAYQQILAFEKLRPGEVNRTQEAVKRASGAAQNAEVLLPARIDPARVRALLPRITCQTI